MSDTPQFLPATGWCYFFYSDDTRTTVGIYDVALWKVQSDGDVVGMISAEVAEINRTVARLTTPPPTGGQYFLKGGDDDPRQWPNPPRVMAFYRTNKDRT